MEAKTKICIVMLDGLADLDQELRGRKRVTPLEAAETPTFDQLAREGITGMHDPVQPGLACGSDCAHLNLFGYNPLRIYK